MIDKNTGNIRLNDWLKLGPNSNFELLVEHDLGETQKVRDMGNGVTSGLTLEILRLRMNIS